MVLASVPASREHTARADHSFLSFFTRRTVVNLSVTARRLCWWLCQPGPRAPQATAGCSQDSLTPQNSLRQDTFGVSAFQRRLSGAGRQA